WPARLGDPPAAHAALSLIDARGVLADPGDRGGVSHRRGADRALRETDMPDIARLSLTVDSSDVKKATDDLKKLPPAATGAERAARGVEQSFRETGTAARQAYAELARART